MASFFEYQTDLAQKATGPVMAQAWSNCDPAVLAVSTGNNISCFLEEVRTAAQHHHTAAVEDECDALTIVVVVM